MEKIISREDNHREMRINRGGEGDDKDGDRDHNDNDESNIKEVEVQKEDKDEDDEDPSSVPLMALNHVSRLCRCVKESIDFYVNVLGFVQIKRPPTLDFDGAWLFNYGIGIHLVQSEEEDRLPDPDHELDPMDNHISFQCEDLEAMEQKLKEKNIKYMKRTVEGDEGGGGAAIDQLFFTDPDGFMIEVCNCENLELVPAGSVGRLRLPSNRHNPPVDLNFKNKKKLHSNGLGT